MTLQPILRPFIRQGVLPLLCLLSSALAMPHTDVHAQEVKPSGRSLINKSRYHLLRPVPETQMRDLSTDRPDKTESPYTVDAGHVQVEVDVFSYTRDRTREARVERYGIATTNLKVGLLNNLDAQMIIETFNIERTRDRLTGLHERRAGFGDLTMRLKYNVWGNDGGSTALAVMPFIKFPTNQDGLGNHAVEGGVIVPLAVELPLGWRLGLMTEIDSTRNAVGRGHHAEFINSITLGHDLIAGLGGYVEFFSLVSTDKASPWIGTVDVGLTYKVTEHLQLDAGVNIGVTDAADDLNPFVGLSFRF